MMQPLRIDFHLGGAVSRPAFPIHLDSLIANRLVQKTLPFEADVPTMRAAIEDLPLERREIGGDWVWTASTIAFDWAAPPQNNLATKAVRAQEIAPFIGARMLSNFRPDTKIDTGRGAFKSSLYTYETQWALKASAFCIGDKVRIAELLEGLDQIGTKRRLGFGKVIDLEIFEDDRANDLWMFRNLPAEANVGRLAEGAYRLPLFEPKHQGVIRHNPLEYAQVAAG